MKPVKLTYQITAIILAFMFALLCPDHCAAQANQQSQATTQGNMNQNVQPAQVGVGIAVGIIIGIGIGGCYAIYRLSTIEPPPLPPPPPPPPPPLFPPIIIFPPIVPYLVTNSPSVPYYGVPAVWVNANIAITNSWDDAASLYDISSLGYTDTNGPTPVPVRYFVVGTVSNLMSSTDLVTWSNYTFNAWLSTNGMVTVLYDGSGVPVITNYGSGNSTGATNTVPFGIWVGAEPHKFFRIVPTQ